VKPLIPKLFISVVSAAQSTFSASFEDFKVIKDFKILTLENTQITEAKKTYPFFFNLSTTAYTTIFITLLISLSGIFFWLQKGFTFPKGETSNLFIFSKIRSFMM